MRIGIDARPLLHPKTGIGRYTSELVVRLAAEPTAEIYLYSNAPLDEFLSTTPNLSKRCLTRSGGFSGKFISTLFAQCVYPWWGHRDKLDIFWSPRHHLPYLFRTPMAVTIHDMVWKKAPETMAPGARFIESLLMPSALKRAVVVFSVSESTRADIIEHDPSLSEKTYVTRLAPSFQRQQTETQASIKNHFLFVGTLEPRKNLSRILKAYSRYRATTEQSISLIIAGNMGWKVDLIKQIERLQLTDSVTFCENPNDQELAELYRTCFCLVMPSLYEGFGLPILEAQCFGKPAITSNIASMPEVAGDAGMLVDPYSIGAIADAMTNLTSNSLLYNSLATAALEQAAQWSWDSTAALTFETLASRISK